MRLVPLSVLLTSISLVSASPTPADIAPRAASTHYLFSFGDSYTTTGFDVNGVLPSCSNPLGNPAFPGATVSGGINWISEVVQLAPPCFLSFNFAVGSALINESLVTPFAPTVVDLIAQVSRFTNLIGTHPTTSAYPWTSATAVAALWLGINDVGNSWMFSNSSTINTLDLASYTNELDVLYTAGVRRFLILTVPPTDRTPYWSSWSAGDDAAVGADVVAFNSALNTAVKNWSGSRKGVQLQVLDTVPIFNYILGHPVLYGAPNNTCQSADGVSCLWFNNYHPGVAIQTAVGVAAYKKLFGDGSLGLR